MRLWGRRGRGYVPRGRSSENSQPSAARPPKGGGGVGNLRRANEQEVCVEREHKDNIILSPAHEPSEVREDGYAWIPAKEESRYCVHCKQWRFVVIPARRLWYVREPDDPETYYQSGP